MRRCKDLTSTRWYSLGGMKQPLDTDKRSVRTMKTCPENLLKSSPGVGSGLTPFLLRGFAAVINRTHLR